MSTPRSFSRAHHERRWIGALRRRLARLRRALSKLDAKPTLRSAHGVEGEQPPVVSGRWR